MRDKIPTPEPVPKDLICSICDEPWYRHPDNPTVMDCVDLLKAKADAPRTYPSYPYTITWTNDQTNLPTYTGSPWISSG